MTVRRPEDLITIGAFARLRRHLHQGRSTLFEPGAPATCCRATEPVSSVLEKPTLWPSSCSAARESCASAGTDSERIIAPRRAGSHDESATSDHATRRDSTVITYLANSLSPVRTVERRAAY